MSTMLPCLRDCILAHLQLRLTLQFGPQFFSRLLYNFSTCTTSSLDSSKSTMRGGGNGGNQGGNHGGGFRGGGNGGGSGGGSGGEPNFTGNFMSQINSFLSTSLGWITSELSELKKAKSEEVEKKK